MGYVNAPIQDLLIRIKNAYMTRKTILQWIVFSNFKMKILELLKQYDFVKNFEVVEEGKKKFLTISLKEVVDPINDIPNIKFYSRPSRAWYIGYKDLKNVAGWKWIWILSTNKWLMAAHVARQQKLWWQLIAEIY